MKRLLLISYYFPPHLAAESLLIASTAKSLIRSKWEITVLTNREKVPGVAKDNSLFKLIPPSIKLMRTGGVEHLLNRQKILRILFRLGLPELEALWLPSAILAYRKLLKQQTFDVIHSWACCHTSNIVGLCLKRHTGLPWVAHFSDPWVNNPYYKPTPIQSAVWNTLEESIIREADAVIFTTSQTVDFVMDKYPASWRKKVRVVPHGFDADFPYERLTRSANNNRLRFVHTGNFYGERSPEWLLRAFRDLGDKVGSLADVELIFVGHVDLKYQEMSNEFGLSNNVVFTGPLPYTKSLGHAECSDVLLVIDAPSEATSVFLPSKLIDYLRFDKPILGLTPQRGATADLLRNIRCPLVNPTDVPGIVAALHELLIKWKNGTLVIYQEQKETASSYRIDLTTNILSECLEACISHAKELKNN